VEKLLAGFLHKSEYYETEQIFLFSLLFTINYNLQYGARLILKA
jgi:hypothetical protein